MNARIDFLKTKYGPDFIKKLRLYKTAKHNGICVSLKSVCLATMVATVVDANKVESSVPVAELDHFVL